MKLASAFSLALAALALTSGAAADARRRDQVRVDANPSEIVAAEMALSRLTRDKGVGAAFLETATQDAILFTPQIVAAQAALKKGSAPLQPMSWTASRVIMSCDGALAVSTGIWQGLNSAGGQFVTVWQRQGDGRGRKEPLKQWKWVAHATTMDPRPATPLEFVETSVASCIKTPVPVMPTMRNTSTRYLKDAAARDRSLLWLVTADSNGAQQLTVETWDGNDYKSTSLPLPGSVTGAAS